MAKVKTFTSDLKILHTMNRLSELDRQVNIFLEQEKVHKVISVSDTCTTDKNGATIGVIRVLAYK